MKKRTYSYSKWSYKWEKIRMDTQCFERIKNNMYGDFIVAYNGDEKVLREYFAGDCVQVINEIFAIVYTRRVDVNDMSIANSAYYIFPKCFGLMDSSSMEESGNNIVTESTGFRIKGKRSNNWYY